MKSSTSLITTSAAWLFATVSLCSVGLASAAAPAVSLGIDELEKSNFAILQGKRIGLVTNPSGADSQGRSAIDVLRHHPGFKLVRLFAPEHGIDGKTKAGDDVTTFRDPRTGLMVCSLYGDTRHPTPEMLEGLDAIVYDVQDLGCRSYTFISTLGYVMQAASQHHLEVIVLDRPDPLGGERIEGPGLSDDVKSFIGLYDIPYVYGLTPGELAMWINGRYLDHPCKLTVVKMKGWTRDMVWEDTGLTWTPTSPYIPTAASARGYVATGFLGEIGMENGVGGPKPFQAVAGQGWDKSELASSFNKVGLTGIHAKPYEFTTTDGRWAGEHYTGFFLEIDPHLASNLTAVSIYAMTICRRLIEKFTPFAHTNSDQREMFDKITGLPSIRHQIAAGRSASAIISSWEPGVKRWSLKRKPFLLYGHPREVDVADTADSGVVNKAMP